MEKLLIKFSNTANERDAIRVMEHARKHPFSVCLIPGEWLAVYDAAKRMACTANPSARYENI